MARIAYDAEVGSCTPRRTTPLGAFTPRALFGAALLAFAAGCGAVPSAATSSDDRHITDPTTCNPGCGAGSICEAGQCVPAPADECTADADCASGEHCSDAHECVKTLHPIDVHVDPQPAPVCASGSLDLLVRPPTVVVLVDQSASMNQRFDGGTRWTVLRDALLNRETGVIKELENDVRFGIALYSSENGYGRNYQRTCPLLKGLDEVPIGFGNFTAIDSLYAAASPIDDTPTAESLAAVTDKLAALDVDGPKAIVLATDGEPDTCDDPDAHDAATNQLSVDTAKSTYAAGIHTYLVSVGTEIAEQHLQAMANAGAGVPDGGPNAPFFRATDQAGLKSALSSIVSDVRTCSFHLTGNLDTSLVAKGTVLLDGEKLAYGTDWTLNAAGEVELLGPRCDSVRSGAHHVQAEFACIDHGVPIVR
ncbi:MAG TPA: vWA domain-containing protein [Polyangiaceae bacterium]|nr:vWA domain-containing protein [Polyangiaceae bacterium]